MIECSAVDPGRGFVELGGEDEGRGGGRRKEEEGMEVRTEECGGQYVGKVMVEAGWGCMAGA